MNNFILVLYALLVSCLFSCKSVDSSNDNESKNIKLKEPSTATFAKIDSVQPDVKKTAKSILQKEGVLGQYNTPVISKSRAQRMFASDKRTKK